MKTMPISNSHKFFSNADCKYFPCHSSADTNAFNCLFCFCPLYSLGDRCGGRFKYGGKESKIKICTDCGLPHDPDYYDTVIDKLKQEIKEL
jgi:Zn-finger protein